MHGCLNNAPEFLVLPIIQVLLAFVRIVEVPCVLLGGLKSYTLLLSMLFVHELYIIVLLMHCHTH